MFHFSIRTVQNSHILYSNLCTARFSMRASNVVRHCSCRLKLNRFSAGLGDPYLTFGNDIAALGYEFLHDQYRNVSSFKQLLKRF